jgi:predicted amidohydrolase YtcJ
MNQSICYIRGTVLTQRRETPRAEAVVTRGNRILFAGTTDDALAAGGPGARVVDLGGRCMLPGFIDGHTHFVQGGMHLEGVNLRACRSAEDFAATLKAYVVGHRGSWITGGDWDQEAWPTRHPPARQMVDPFSADTPIFVQRFDGHMGLANGAALRAAGITASTPDPDGGVIERDPATGEPTGILKDAAIPLVTGRVPPPSAAAIRHAVGIALLEAARNGVTSIHDITLPEQLPVFEAMAADGELTVHVYARLPIAMRRELIDRGVTAGAEEGRVSLGSLKAFSDGSLGSDTAWFFEPYSHNSSLTGLAMNVVTSGELREWALEADRHRLQLSIHAIGDRANDAVLRIFEEIARTNPPWDRRFRIEHAQHLRPDDFVRFASLGVVVSAQPYHCIDDGVWAEGRIGADRARTTYAFRSFVDAGVHVCFGSDWTVAPLKPIGGIYAAVTRRTLDGTRPGGWVPEQRLTVEQALQCYTVEGAYAAFEERLRGSITPGKIADLVVLSRDPTIVPPEDLLDIAVDMTIADGQTVYSR